MKKVFVLVAVVLVVVGFFGLSKACKKTKISKEKNTKKTECVFKNCSEVKDCSEAKYLLKKCGFSKLDNDNDGIPCESICK